jgi:xanthine dehydrogenase YagS FAD-binding subunit
MLQELPEFDHVAVGDPAEALAWLRKGGDRARLIAGGTDLLGLMKDRVQGPRLRIPEVLVDVRSVPAMREISEADGGGLSIGASVSLSRLVADQTVASRLPILAQAAGQVGSTAVRNLGTVGGNLCQRPRCLYFRHPQFPCRRKGGEACFAVAGEHRCHHSILSYGLCSAACMSDLAPALAALRALAVIRGEGGDREEPLERFFCSADPLADTCLRSDELLESVRIPWAGSGSRQAFRKHRVRNAVDFALASVAAEVRLADDGACEDASIFLGAVAPFPWRFKSAEAYIRGRRLSRDLIREAAQAPLEGLRPLPANGFKVQVIRALVERVLGDVAGSNLDSTSTRI